MASVNATWETRDERTDLESRILACADEHSRVGRPRNAVHSCDVSPQTRNESDCDEKAVRCDLSTDRINERSLSRASLPKLDGVVKPSTRNPAPVGREGDVVDLLLVACQARERLFGVVGGERRPEEECVVVRTGDEELRLGRGELRVAGEGKCLRWITGRSQVLEERASG